MAELSTTNPPVPSGITALALAVTVPLPEIVMVASDNLASAVNSLLPVESRAPVIVVTVTPDISNSSVSSISKISSVPSPIIDLPVTLAAVALIVFPDAMVTVFVSMILLDHSH